MAQDTGQDLELSERHLAQRDGQAQFLEAVAQVLGTLARTAAPSGGVANLLPGEQPVQGVDRASAGRRCRLGRPFLQGACHTPAPRRGTPAPTAGRLGPPSPKTPDLYGNPSHTDRSTC